MSNLILNNSSPELLSSRSPTSLMLWERPSGPIPLIPSLKYLALMYPVTESDIRSLVHTYRHHPLDLTLWDCGEAPYSAFHALCTIATGLEIRGVDCPQFEDMLITLYKDNPHLHYLETDKGSWRRDLNNFEAAQYWVLVNHRLKLVPKNIRHLITTYILCWNRRETIDLRNTANESPNKKQKR